MKKNKDLKKLNISKYEKRFIDDALNNNWNIIRSGWPDFLLEKDNEIIAVEVKGKGDKPSLNQLAVMELLVRKGIKCFIVKYVKKKHGSKKTFTVPPYDSYSSYSYWIKNKYTYKTI